MKEVKDFASFDKRSWFKFNKYILQQYGKSVKTKSQKVLGANFYVCRSYRRKKN